MIRILKILFFLAAITALFLIFDKNSDPQELYLLSKTLTLPAYLLYIIFITIGIIIGYLVSLKSVFSYRSEIKKLIKNNKDLSDELDSLRNVAINDDISFDQED